MASIEHDRMPDDAAVLSRTCAGSPDQIWSVLADGFTYGAWVVGASHVRAVDPTWPAPGARLHHAVGAWPVLLRDSTSVERSSPARSLLLLAHARPFGHARVLIEIEPLRGGAVVTMSEAPVSPGLRATLPRTIWAPMLRARNNETLGRLIALAERREQPRDSDEPVSAQGA
jgi:hypothetical protein